MLFLCGEAQGFMKVCGRGLIWLREGAGEEGWRPSRGDMRRGFLSYAGSSDRSVENVVKRLSEFGFRGKR